MARKKKQKKATERTLRLRVLHVTIACASMLLVVKLVDIYRGGNELANMLLVGEVVAEEKTEDAEKEEAKKDDSAEKVADTEEKADDAENAEEVAEGEEGESKKDAKKDEAEKVAVEEEKRPEPVKEFSQVELDILQSLAKRRELLDEWAEENRLKENVLQATELRINDKLAQMEELRKNLEILLQQYSTEEDAKIRSLVKIYENMKPKDAARIFDEVEMPILLLVIDRMSERKAAPVLANMNPLKAKEVTMELAEERKIHSTTTESPLLAKPTQQPAAPASVPAPKAMPKPTPITPPAMPAPGAAAKPETTDADAAPARQPAPSEGEDEVPEEGATKANGERKAAATAEGETKSVPEKPAEE